MAARDWRTSLVFRWSALLIGTTASVLGDFHVSDAGRLALAGTVVAAGLTSVASAPRFMAVRPLFWGAATFELVGALALIATTDAPFSPFVLAAASPLLAAALADRRLLIVLSAAAVMGVPYVSVLHPSRGLPVTIHAAAVVLSIPWLAYVIRSGPDTTQRKRPRRVSLTPHERRLLEMLALGLTYAQIAERNEVSVETAKVHIARLYRRLGAANRQQAVELGAELEPD